MPAALAPDQHEAPVAVYHLDLQERHPEQPLLSRPEDREWMEPLLQQNAVWFCRLRWLVIAVLGGAGVASLVPNSLRALGLVISPAWPLAAAAVLTGLNLAFAGFSKAGTRSAASLTREKTRETQPVASSTQGTRSRTQWKASLPPVRLLLWGQIVSDLLVLTAVIHWLGHPFLAAPFMYLFHIILACIVFAPGESLAVAGLAAAFYLASLALESFGWLSRASVMAGESISTGTPLTSAPSGLSVFSMLLIWTVIWYLVSRLASAFRSRDRELYISNRRLRASIEERSTHMLQTTHQLKAPFAAIHAQCQLLLGDYCGALPAQARVTVEKMSARCLVLARQIQEMLQLANLRSQGQSSPPRRPLNLGSVIEDILTRVEPAARQRGVRFEKEIQPATIEAVEDHVTMLIDNLLVNAVNYSYENGLVKITCRQQPPDRTVLTVRDQGIGIPKEKLPRIFDDYYRTEEAVQHNRGSTGLGLAIVRQVACKDCLPVMVESAPGWGTRFTVHFLSASPNSSLSSAHINN